jgi:hypothetical protein
MPFLRHDAQERTKTLFDCPPIVPNNFLGVKSVAEEVGGCRRVAEFENGDGLARARIFCKRGSVLTVFIAVERRQTWSRAIRVS